MRPATICRFENGTMDDNTFMEQGEAQCSSRTLESLDWWVGHSSTNVLAECSLYIDCDKQNREFSYLVNCFLCVIRQVRINLCAHPSRHNVQQLKANIYRQHIGNSCIWPTESTKCCSSDQCRASYPFAYMKPWNLFLVLSDEPLEGRDCVDAAIWRQKRFQPSR